MYTSFDNKPFSTEEELQAYEYDELRRTKIKLCLSNVLGYFVKDQVGLDRVCELELDDDFQTFISDTITFPDWIVTFSDDEAKEFHVVSLNQAASYACEHISKVFR